MSDLSDISSSSEEDPFADSGSEYIPSESSDHDIPGPSRKGKNLFPAKTVQQSSTAAGLKRKEKKGKKRVRMKSSWKRNVIKSKKAKGEEYKNWANKKILKRAIGPNCECRMKCFTKITDMDKQNIFKQFYDIGNKNRQDIYLGGLMTVLNIQRKRPTTGEGRAKTSSFQYKVILFFCKRT